ncbi:hypothetical protein CY35_03G091400 [Sphagnum magellanicum]|nr:hypothetical protein CY35_03G091400 [Sphagnum magellanicum]
MIEVFLSTARNVAALTDIKIMFMDFMGKFEEEGCQKLARPFLARKELQGRILLPKGSSSESAISRLHVGAGGWCQGEVI